MSKNKDYAEWLEKNKDEIKEQVKWFIKHEISFKSRFTANYHVSRNLGTLLETFCGAEIDDSRPEWLWKRKATCELIDDPELNALAAEIVRHEQEDFDGIDPEDYREDEESNEVKIHDCWEWHE